MLGKKLKGVGISSSKLDTGDYEICNITRLRKVVALVTQPLSSPFPLRSVLAGAQIMDI